MSPFAFFVAAVAFGAFRAEGACANGDEASTSQRPGDPCAYFGDSPSCCSSQSTDLMKKSQAIIAHNFDNCVSCNHNWMHVLCSANCNKDQSKFIKVRNFTNSHGAPRRNYTLVLDPHLCTKLWYSCEDEDTDEFGGKGRSLRYIFDSKALEDFEVFNRPKGNSTDWDITGASVGSQFESAGEAMGDAAKGFGFSLLPSNVSNKIMPAGAENFCVAMGSTIAGALQISLSL
jgi:hypothetical protein